MSVINEMARYDMERNLIILRKRRTKVLEKENERFRWFYSATLNYIKLSMPGRK